MMFKPSFHSVLACLLALVAAPVFAAPSQPEPAQLQGNPKLITTYPDQEMLKEVIELGLAAKHQESLNVAHRYIALHEDHPCGHFAAGIVHEWNIEPLDPEPYLGPAIENFEAAGALHEKERADGKVDITAGFCRGASFIRLARIYYKYGQNTLAVRRGISGAKELEKVAAAVPDFYDVYAFLGPYHYFTDRSPAAVRLIMRLFGLKGDRQQGLRELETAWQKAPLFKHEAGHILYGIMAHYENNYAAYKPILDQLIELYPQNVIFQRLQAKATKQLAASSPTLDVAR